MFQEPALAPDSKKHAYIAASYFALQKNQSKQPFDQRGNLWKFSKRKGKQRKTQAFDGGNLWAADLQWPLRQRLESVRLGQGSTMDLAYHCYGGLEFLGSEMWPFWDGLVCGVWFSLIWFCFVLVLFQFCFVWFGCYVGSGIGFMRTFLQNLKSVFFLMMSWLGWLAVSLVVFWNQAWLGMDLWVKPCRAPVPFGMRRPTLLLSCLFFQASKIGLH